MAVPPRWPIASRGYSWDLASDVPCSVSSGNTNRGSAYLARAHCACRASHGIGCFARRQILRLSLTPQDPAVVEVLARPDERRAGLPLLDGLVDFTSEGWHGGRTGLGPPRPVHPRTWSVALVRHDASYLSVGCRHRVAEWDRTFLGQGTRNFIRFYPNRASRS